MRKFQILLALVLLGLVGYRIFHKPAKLEITSFGTVSDFTFTDQDGKPFGTADLKGKPWVVDFVFTRCMGPCPLMTFHMSELQKEFSNTDLKFVSFSVDPEFDSPKELKKYAGNYNADFSRWHFLTGKKVEIYKTIRESFKLAVEQGPATTSTANDFVHSTNFVLVGRDGSIKGYFNVTEEGAMDRLRTQLKNLS